MLLLPSILRVPQRFVWLVLGLVTVAALVHLNADAPWHVLWSLDDPSRYTDEGWYASGALNHRLFGHWLRPGDFNPMVTVPVWSLLVAGLFHFTGISLAWARALAVLFNFGTVLLGGLLLKDEARSKRLVYMLLLGTSPILFYFARQSLLESPLVFFLMAAAVLANRTRGSVVSSVGCGLVFALAMVTKSSALFVAPALLYLLWLRNPTGRIARIATPVLIAAVTFGLYWLLCIHSHPADFKALYRENAPVLNLHSIEKAVRLVYRCFTWADPIFFLLALLAAAAAFTRLPALRRDPLFGFAGLWFLGYSGFMVLHIAASPHYFTVLIFPIMLLAVLLLGSLEGTTSRFAQAINVLALLAVLWNTAYIGKMLLMHQHYTFHDACLQIRQHIEADPTAKHLVLGHGAMETTFYTLVPALDDIGATPVPDKLQQDKPGWLLIYNIDADIYQKPIYTDHYNFILEGEYPVFEQPVRNRLMLYRIVTK